MVDEIALSIKEDLLRVIQEKWNQFDKEYCFKLKKSMFERIKAEIKAWGGTAKY